MSSTGEFLPTALMTADPNFVPGSDAEEEPAAGPVLDVPSSFIDFEIPGSGSSPGTIRTIAIDTLTVSAVEQHDKNSCAVYAGPHRHIVRGVLNQIAGVIEEAREKYKANDPGRRPGDFLVSFLRQQQERMEEDRRRSEEYQHQAEEEWKVSKFNPESPNYDANADPHEVSPGTWPFRGFRRAGVAPAPAKQDGEG